MMTYVSPFRGAGITTSREEASYVLYVAPGGSDEGVYDIDTDRGCSLRDGAMAACPACGGR